MCTIARHLSALRIVRAVVKADDRGLGACGRLVHHAVGYADALGGAGVDGFATRLVRALFIGFAAEGAEGVDASGVGAVVAFAVDDFLRADAGVAVVCAVVNAEASSADRLAGEVDLLCVGERAGLAVACAAGGPDQCKPDACAGENESTERLNHVFPSHFIAHGDLLLCVGMLQPARKAAHKSLSRIVAACADGVNEVKVSPGVET